LLSLGKAEEMDQKSQVGRMDRVDTSFSHLKKLDSSYIEYRSGKDAMKKEISEKRKHVRFL